MFSLFQIPFVVLFYVLIDCGILNFIALLLKDVRIPNVYALRDGQVFDASHRTVIQDATFMANVKMVHAYVFLVGMASTAL